MGSLVSQERGLSVRRGARLLAENTCGPGSYVMAVAQLNGPVQMPLLAHNRCDATGLDPDTPPPHHPISTHAKHLASKALTLQLTLTLPAKHLSHQWSYELQAKAKSQRALVLLCSPGPAPQLLSVGSGPFLGLCGLRDTQVSHCPAPTALTAARPGSGSGLRASRGPRGCPSPFSM